MKSVKYLIFFIIVFSCKERDTGKNSIEDENNQETFCDINMESRDYLYKILNTGKVKSTLNMWHSIGNYNVMLKTDIPISQKKIKIDSFYIQFSDEIKKEKDLILTLKRQNCRSGTFFLTTNVPNSFSLSGNFIKSNNDWIIELTNYVEQ